MPGMLLGLVRETLVKEYGQPMWDALIAAGSTRGPESVGAGKTGDGADLPSDALACWLARHSVPTLRDTYPSLFARHPDLESFVRAFGDELPAVVDRTGDPSSAGTFRYQDTPDGDLLVKIEAESPICALIEGLIAGAAVHYDEAVLIEELKCRKRGDNACLIRIAFGEEPLAADLGPGADDMRVAGGA